MKNSRSGMTMKIGTVDRMVWWNGRDTWPSEMFERAMLTVKRTEKAMRVRWDRRVREESEKDRADRSVVKVDEDDDEVGDGGDGGREKSSRREMPTAAVVVWKVVSSHGNGRSIRMALFDRVRTRLRLK